MKALHFQSMFLAVRLGSTPSVFPTGGLVLLTALMGVGIFGVATIEWRTLLGAMK